MLYNAFPLQDLVQSLLLIPKAISNLILAKPEQRNVINILGENSLTTDIIAETTELYQ